MNNGDERWISGIEAFERIECYHHSDVRLAYLVGFALGTVATGTGVLLIYFWPRLMGG